VRPLTRYNAIAVFEDFRTARRAIDALGVAGIGGDAISLRGPAADEAAQQRSVTSPDKQVLQYVTAHVNAGALLGAFMGGLLGPPIAWLIFGFGPGGVLLTLFFAALGLGIVGALLGSMFPLHGGDTWEPSFRPTHDRRASVGVHSNEPGEVARAFQILLKQDALETYRVDAQGQRI
jgi:hypothetical protein